MDGYVMQLQNYSVNDGEGIRTNIFLAGCPLRCRWCSNPEGQTCNAMTHVMDTEEVLQVIQKQMIFYRNSGGGVTFSGGEATMQAEFLRELSGKLYDMGVSLAIETCGFFPFDEIKDILERMDLIFYDLKHMDEDRHRELTGQSNRVILDNFPRVAALGIPLVVRIPVIIGANADEENLSRTFAFIRDAAPAARLELLPYHRFGEKKYEELGLALPPAAYQIPAQEQIAGWEALARSMGVETVSYR